MCAKTAHIRLSDCNVKAAKGACFSIENEQSSVTAIGGEFASSKGDCISIKAGAKGYFKLVDLITANQGFGIKVDNGGIAIVDAVNNIYGQNAAVFAGSGSTCYLVGCGSVSSGGDDVISLGGGWVILRGGMELGAIKRVVGGEGAFMALKLLNDRYGQ
jgi:hypothetical protein